MGKILDVFDEQLIEWIAAQDVRYAVPFMDERPTLQQWAARKDDDELVTYWAEKNTRSVDGLPALT